MTSGDVDLLGSSMLLLVRDLLRVEPISNGKDVETAVLRLRHQRAVLYRQVTRPHYSSADRDALAIAAS
jgi:hypothetical protein